MSVAIKIRTTQNKNAVGAADVIRCNAAVLHAYTEYVYCRVKLLDGCVERTQRHKMYYSYKPAALNFTAL